MSYQQSQDPRRQRQQIERCSDAGDSAQGAYTLAIILTVLGYTVSCLFCLAAIWQINKAERAGYDLYGWRVANWVGLALGSLWTIFFVIWLLAAIF